MPELPTLWPHQLAAVNATLSAIAAGRACGMVVLPTGTGKTGFVLALGRRLRVPMLFLVNRDELLGQTLRAAPLFWPEALAAAVEAGTGAWDEPDLYAGRRPDLVVAMVPSLQGQRLESVARDRFGLLVADEAHFAATPTWRRVLGHFEAGFRLGVTATPQRHDGQGLADLFGREPVYSYSLFQAIKDGRLVQVDVRTVRTDVSLDGVGAPDGDLAEGALSRAVNTPARNALVVEAYRAHGTGRRTIAFCADVAHAHDLADALAAGGARAAAIHGSLSKGARRDVLARFAAGDLQVVCNCEVLTYGFDDPGVSCLLMARPTASRPLYLQMTGRGLRLAPAKKDCLLIDFVDNSRKHKLACALDLLGKGRGAPPETRSPRRAPDEGPRQRPLPLPTALVSWRLESVCPWPEMPSLEGYVPSWSWQEEPATEGQYRYLATFGLRVEWELTKGEASYLLDRCQEYEAAFPLPATPRQRAFLQHHGLWQEGLGKRQASALIDTVQAGLARQEETRGR